MPADTKVDLPYAAQHTAPLLMLWTCAVFYCEIEVVYLFIRLAGTKLHVHATTRVH